MAHPLHGTRPLARSLQVAWKGAAPSDICLWKTHPAHAGWGHNGGHLFTGTRLQAEERAAHMGIPSAQVVRA